MAQVYEDVTDDYQDATEETQWDFLDEMDSDAPALTDEDGPYDGDGPWR